jgi:hypothetical protein
MVLSLVGSFWSSHFARPVCIRHSFGIVSLHYVILRRVWVDRWKRGGAPHRDTPNGLCTCIHAHSDVGCVLPQTAGTPGLQRQSHHGKEISRGLAYTDGADPNPPLPLPATTPTPSLPPTSDMHEVLPYFRGSCRAGRTNPFSPAFFRRCT